MNTKRILLSIATRSAALHAGPHPTREGLKVACGRAAAEWPSVSSEDIFSVMSGATDWAATRARMMAA
jgi:hypothetical protein